MGNPIIVDNTPGMYMGGYTATDALNYINKNSINEVKLDTGTTTGNKWSGADIGNLLSGVASAITGIGNMVSSIITAKGVSKSIQSGNYYSSYNPSGTYSQMQQTAGSNMTMLLLVGGVLLTVVLVVKK